MVPVRKTSSARGSLQYLKTVGTWRALLVITLLVVLALGLSRGPRLLSPPSSTHLSDIGVKGGGGLDWLDWLEGLVTLPQLELLVDTDR